MHIHGTHPVTDRLAVARAPAGIPGLVIVAFEISMIPELLDRIFCVVMRVVFTECMLGATSLIINRENLQLHK